jgi:hypothetical protein
MDSPNFHPRRNTARQRIFDFPTLVSHLKKQAGGPPFLIQRSHLRGPHFRPQPTLFAKVGLTGLGDEGGEKWFSGTSSGTTNQAIVTQ